MSCIVQDWSNKGRLGASPREGATLQLTITTTTTTNDKKTETHSLRVIIKQVPEKGRPLSQQLGLAREALFYKHFLSELSDPTTVPKIYYSFGDITKGEKCVVMEDLSESAVDSAVFFGPGNPNSWNKDLQSHVNRANEALGRTISTSEVAEKTFRVMARIHAKFWKRKDVLLSSDKAWLRGQSWLRGEGHESWEASQGLVRSIWHQYTATADSTDKKSITWDPVLKSAVAKAIEGISWEAQMARLNPDHSHWTLVHGDFWPGNVMWMIRDGSIKLLDWEMCGLGSGPQDLGQYVLSNMEPAERRANERRLIEAYHEELCAAGVKDVGFDFCWQEYKVGGLERWLWFLVYFLGQEGFTDWAQFFHDQMASFMHDHGITADDVTQVRP